MELAKKGQSAELESLKALVATMSWSFKADFDIAALYEDKSGKKGMVYFGAKGDLNAPPFMKLSGDAGVGDTGGANEEILKITKLDDIKTLHICVWDYGMIQTGKAARFKEANVQLTLMDDKGNKTLVKLDVSDVANVIVVATIDNSSPIGGKLINTSKTGTLKSFEKSEQLWAIADAP